MCIRDSPKPLVKIARRNEQLYAISPPSVHSRCRSGVAVIHTGCGLGLGMCMAAQRTSSTIAASPPSPK
eukprot:422010-Alexandrium_andersonii.AAC.1